MRIILPPSETKQLTDSGHVFSHEHVSFRELLDTRQLLMERVAQMCAGDESVALKNLKISEKMRGELKHNTNLFSSPTCPAIDRYTGVLFAALDYPSLSDEHKRLASQRVVISSALFGFLAPQDFIPYYRFSAGSKLSYGLTLKKIWSAAPVVEQIAAEPLIIDARSGAYAGLIALPGAYSVRVEQLQADGSRKVVSHFAKHYRGVLARLLCQSSEEFSNIEQVADYCSTHGIKVEVSSDSITMVVAPH